RARHGRGPADAGGYRGDRAVRTVRPAARDRVVVAAPADRRRLRPARPDPHHGALLRHGRGPGQAGAGRVPDRGPQARRRRGELPGAGRLPGRGGFGPVGGHALRRRPRPAARGRSPLPRGGPGPGFAHRAERGGSAAAGRAGTRLTALLVRLVLEVSGLAGECPIEEPGQPSESARGLSGPGVAHRGPFSLQRSSWPVLIRYVVI